MKKIIFALLLFITTSAYAQSPFGRKNTILTRKEWVGIGLTFGVFPMSLWMTNRYSSNPNYMYGAFPVLGAGITFGVVGMRRK